MKKMGKSVWVTALIAGMAASVTVNANPSIYSVTNENEAVSVVKSDYTTVELAEDKVIVKAADVEKFKESEEIQKVITMLEDEENVYTTAELLETFGIELEEAEFTTTNGNEVVVEKLEPITTLTMFVYESSGEILEDGQIEATIQGGEAVKEEEKENLIIVQLEYKKEEAKVYFIEMEELQEDGTYTAKFPCAGPFFVAYVAE